MGLLCSTTIRDIEENVDYHKLNFSLYHKDTMFPYGGSMSYHTITNRFKDVVFVYNVQELNIKEIQQALLHNAELVMLTNTGYDRSDFYLIIPKTNLMIGKMIDNAHYDLEIIVDEEKPQIFNLWVADSRIKRSKKLKKIRQNING
jgi:hypothetical protein